MAFLTFLILPGNTLTVLLMGWLPPGLFAAALILPPLLMSLGTLGPMRASLERAAGRRPGTRHFLPPFPGLLPGLSAAFLTAVLPELGAVGLVLLGVALVGRLTVWLTGLLLLSLAITAYVYTRWFLVLPLVLDGQRSLAEACRTSARLVHPQWPSAVRFVATLFGLSLIGYVFFGIGLLMAPPLMAAGRVALYESFFGSRGPEPQKEGEPGLGPSSSRSGGGPLGTGHLGRDPFAFGVGALLGRAWELLRPDLLKHVGFLVTLVLLELILVGMAEAVKSSLLVLFLSLVAAIVGSLLASGHLLAALERASGLTPTFGDFFGVRHRALTVVFAMWLQALIPQLSGLLLLLFAWLLSLTGGDVGVLVFFVAGVWLMLYLGFGYMITIPLVLDQNLSPWRALTTSARALRGRRLTVLGVLAVLFLINVLGALPFGLGLLVTAPLGPTAIVAVYEALFGITGRLPGRRSTLASSWSPPLR